MPNETKLKLISAIEEIRLLKEHIKVLEEGGDCAEITETFWNIHNKDLEDERQEHIKKIKKLEETHKEVFDEREIWELCFHTFGHIDMIMDDEGLSGIIRCVEDDIEKRWHKHPDSNSGKVDSLFNKLYPIALTMAFRLARNIHNIDVPLDYDGTIDIYDEEGAKEHLIRIIEDYNYELEDEEPHINFLDCDEVCDYIEAINDVCGETERDYHYLPSVNEEGKNLLILIGLDDLY